MKQFIIAVWILCVGQIAFCSDGQLQGFDKDYYLSAKLSALRAVDNSWDGKTINDLESCLQSYGFSAEAHYSQYGYLEGFSPNQYFNHSEYIEAKAIAMKNSGAYSTVDQARAAFVAAWPGDAYLHYIAFGFAEGINPSNNFDGQIYLANKLAALKARATGWNDKTVSDLRAFLAEYGMTAIDHFFRFGVSEGLVPPAVPEDEKVNPTVSAYGSTANTQWRESNDFTQNIMEIIAGTYSGTYTGDRTGYWVVAIDSNGAIKGAGHDNRSGSFTASGSVNSNGEMLLIKGTAGSTATFTGVITLQGKMSGSWIENISDTGTYCGEKEDTGALIGPNLSSSIGLTFTFQGYRESTPSVIWTESMKFLGASALHGFLVEQQNYQNDGKTRIRLSGSPIGSDINELVGTTAYRIDDDGDLERTTHTLETVTVPAGTFEALKSVSSVTTYIPGLPYDAHLFLLSKTYINYFSLEPFLLIKSVDYWVNDPAPIINELIAY